MNSPVSAQRGTAFDLVGETARLMVYSLLAISLMALDYRGQYVERFRSAATYLVEPLFWAVDLPFSSAERLALAWRNRAESESRIAELELEISQARARLGRLDDLEMENAQLRRLLDTARRTAQEFIAVEIASVDLDTFAHRIMVRGGRDKGIEAGMPVIDSTGVLGQVEQVLNGMSQIILISDPDHALPVQILPGGERTIAYGSGRLQQLRLTDLPMNAQVNPEDLIVTSGIGGRFPPGLPVARIQSVQRQPGEPFATALATPLSAMARNRLALILRPVRQPDEQTPGAPDPQPDDEIGGPARDADASDDATVPRSGAAQDDDAT